MVELAHGNWAMTAFMRPLRHIAGLNAAKANHELASAACCTASIRPLRTAATVTRNAAVTVAEALGAEISCLEVDALVEGYIGRRRKALGRELDLADRRRRAAKHPGPGPRRPASGCSPTCTTHCCSRPAIAAKRRSAMPRWTATPAAASARSPASTKRSCLDWLRWLETNGPARPRSDSRARRRQPACSPTAELRPPAAGQTDEADLMPYRRARRHRARRHPRQAAARWKSSSRSAPQFPQYGPAQMRRLGRAVLPALVPQPMEARALRPVVSTSTTKTSIPKPGAASRFFPAVLNGSWRNCGSMPPDFRRVGQARFKRAPAHYFLA